MSGDEPGDRFLPPRGTPGRLTVGGVVTNRTRIEATWLKDSG